MSTLRNLDWMIVSVLFCLALLSLSALYPHSILNEEDFFFRQLVFFLFGFSLLFIFPFFNISFLKKQRILIFSFYIIGLLLLGLVLLIAQDVRGAASWLFFLAAGGVGFQPSEVMKIILIFILARYFAFKHVALTSIALSGLYVGIPAAFILLQPDLGSAVVIALLWIGIISLADLQWKHALLLLIFFLFLISMMWGWLLEPYQKTRIISFLDPQSDPLGANYSRNQSLIAIGAGGLFGRGFGGNLHSLDGFLPEAHTDFMFSMLSEALGLTGVAIIFILYAVIIWRLMSFEGKGQFDRLFASSLALLIFIQASMNIAIALGLLPVTGLTLPFLSYGGSSLISLFIGLGIYQALYVRS